MTIIEITEEQLSLFKEGATVQYNDYVYYHFPNIIRKNILTNEVALFTINEIPEEILEYLLDK